MLVLPVMVGKKGNGQATVSVFDLAGKIMLRKVVAVKNGRPTPVGIALCKGIFIAEVEGDGVAAGRVKIIAQE